MNITENEIAGAVTGHFRSSIDAAVRAISNVVDDAWAPEVEVTNLDNLALPSVYIEVLTPNGCILRLLALPYAPPD